MKLPKMKIGVLYGGLSRERDVSIVSGNAVLKSLLENGENAIGVDVKDDIEKVLPELGIDVAFIALHGSFGEDGGIQSLLEKAGIPYTGTGVEASRLAMDKVESKKTLISAKINTPAYKVLKKKKLRDDILNEAEEFGYPAVMKPVAEGSSIGVVILHSGENLAAHIEKAFEFGDILMERFIQGREFTVGILGDTALPVIELRTKREFYDYYAKYEDNATQYLVPAPIDANLERLLQDSAMRTFKALGAYGFGRVDLMLDSNNNVFVLELNTIPGFTSHSLLPKAALAAGIPFYELNVKIIEMALQRASK